MFHVQPFLNLSAILDVAVSVRELFAYNIPPPAHLSIHGLNYRRRTVEGGKKGTPLVVTKGK
eukprot:scaffold366088_cov22-Attheya_sp.AAC.1